ncbi:N-acetylglucosamine-6-phosphate deacetylase [Thermosynechococcaceae cyanobacterium BACA0444]|uniref:N-acetylglucosamine-6-phosphate deacetylase n=1 Tax=Pseudocalidococcus azoricus BACA0444 TaxID=2918990 RepID=A0AAE4FT24_9CYAN|nr:N-acetylglucosamine-6-phosphate deacetylase [Pseudocalidococcus azoricus]MDS3861308.1 N-acetylglucosamine-6-phosphate deacetylase [Pseudocalidococcus azoricus BACA0444]
MAAKRKGFKQSLPQTTPTLTTPTPELSPPTPATAQQSWPTFWIEQVNLVGFRGPQQLLSDSQGCVAAIAPQAETVDWPADYRVKFSGDYLSLPGLDLQINGVLGLPFPEVRGDEVGRFRLEQAGRFLAEAGVDSFLPTIVTCPVQQIRVALGVFAQFLDKPDAGAKILGIHLEGPFLNPERRGAHPQQHLLPLTIENVKRVLGDYSSVVKLITLAPELDETGQVIPYLRDLGITVSLGHSQATASQAQTAFDQGVTMLTHAFNAMPGLHHRQPGPLGAAIADPRVSYGLIADGQHVDPLMLEMLIHTDRPEKRGTFLVSDALAPLGLGDGVYPWDQREITVTNGTARLGDGTLAGTTLPLFRGVQNLVKWGICSPDEAIRLATNAPRDAMSLPGLEVGYPLNRLVAWDYEPESRHLNWEYFGLPDLIM